MRLPVRAMALPASGDLPLACHLAELAAAAEPADVSIKRARADLYRRRAETESSVMAKGIFRAAADE
jgi:hypothetical protein